MDPNERVILADVSKDILLQEMVPENLEPAHVMSWGRASCQILHHILWLQKSSNMNR